MPLAVGTVVAGAALVGTAFDGLLRPDRDNRSASGPDARERGTLLTFPADTASQPQPEVSASPSPPTGLGRSAGDGGVGNDRAGDARGREQAVVVPAADRPGTARAGNGPTPRAADGPEDQPPGAPTPGEPPAGDPPPGEDPPGEDPPVPLPSLPLPSLPLPPVPSLPSLP